MKRYLFHFYVIFRNIFNKKIDYKDFNQWDFVRLLSTVILLWGIVVYYIECNEIEEIETGIIVSSNNKAKLHITNMHYVFDYGGNNDCFYKPQEENKPGFYINAEVGPYDTLSTKWNRLIGEAVLQNVEASDSVKLLAGIVLNSNYDKGVISSDYQIKDTNLSNDLDVVELVENLKKDKVTHPEYIGSILKFSISSTNDRIFKPKDWYLPKDVETIFYNQQLSSFVSDSILGYWKKKTNTRENMTLSTIVFAPSVDLHKLAPINLNVNLSSYKPNIMWATDVSQTTHKLGFSNFNNVQLVIDTLTFDYKGIVYFSNISPRPDSIGASFIQFTDSAKLASIVNNGFHFGSKNPDMENKVVMKLFLLTGLITALFGFICSLLFRIFKPISKWIYSKLKFLVWLIIIITWGFLIYFILASRF